MAKRSQTILENSDYSDFGTEQNMEYQRIDYNSFQVQNVVSVTRFARDFMATLNSDESFLVCGAWLSYQFLTSFRISLTSTPYISTKM